MNPKTAVLAYLLSALASLHGAWASEDLPPGCVKQLGPGGCMGKSRIESVVVSPAQACLKLYVNNCNGGIVSIDNQCAYPLELGDIRVKIKATPPEDSIELFRDEAGTVRAKFSAGNDASYSPVKDEDLLTNAKLGKIDLQLRYKKTKPFCP